MFNNIKEFFLTMMGKKKEDKYHMFRPKLTCEDIMKAKIRKHNGETFEDIAKDFNVSATTISRAIKCETHKHCCEDNKDL